MRFASLDDQRLFESVTISIPGSLPEKVSLYCEGKGEYIRSIRNYKRGLTQSANWRKYRFNYEVGIRRYNRSYRAQANRRRTARNFLTRINRKSESELFLNVYEYDRYHLAENIAEAKKIIYHDMTRFKLEEEYVESVVFYDWLLLNIAEIETKLHFEDEVILTEEHLETIFLLIGEEILAEMAEQEVNEDYSEDLLINRFSNLIGKNFEKDTESELEAE